ncbi:MAG: biotin transporter BioY [Oscillospiraceae bacterium]|nr:biotin transporter BioY [Oscillospiraceae bacterium]
MRKNKIFDITLIALMAAVICVCSWITIPLGTIPFTLQTFGVFLALRFLGGKKGTASIIIYLLLGAVGLPVFSNFGAGVGKILGPTGGYMLGFIFSGITIILLEKFDKQIKYLRIVTDIIALTGCYALGTAWFYFFIGKNSGMSIFAVLSACVIPFIIPDIVKIALSEIISLKIPNKIKLK